MPTRIVPTMFILAGLAALVGCSQDPTSGASTETTNGLSGWVRDPEGIPLSGARVSVWDARGDSMLASVSTDSDGHWNAPLRPGRYGILATSGDFQNIAWKIDAGSNRAPIDIQAGKPAKAYFAGATRLRLLGTPLRTTNGLFPKVPAGSFTVMPDSGVHAAPLASFLAKPGSEDTLRPAPDSGILLDDFEDGDGAFVFASRYPDGFWSLTGTNNLNVGAAIKNPDIGKETALEICYSSDLGNFAQATLPFGEPTNLRGMRSLRFRIKGDGYLSIQIWGTIGSTQYNTTWNYGKVKSALLWTNVSLQPKDADPVKPGPEHTVPWNKIDTVVTKIVFQARGGTSVWIDDIRMDGIDPAAFLP